MKKLFIPDSKIIHLRMQLFFETRTKNDNYFWFSSSRNTFETGGLTIETAYQVHELSKMDLEKRWIADRFLARLKVRSIDSYVWISHPSRYLLTSKLKFVKKLQFFILNFFLQFPQEHYIIVNNSGCRKK